MFQGVLDRGGEKWASWKWKHDIKTRSGCSLVLGDVSTWSVIARPCRVRISNDRRRQKDFDEED